MQIDFAPPSVMRTLARTSALTWSACSIGVLACALAGYTASKLMAQQADCTLARQRAVAQSPSPSPSPGNTAPSLASCRTAAP